MDARLNTSTSLTDFVWRGLAIELNIMVMVLLNLVLFAKALDHLPVSIGYPILASSGFAMLSVSSWAIYGEKLDLLQTIGLIVVIVGIGILSYSISD